MYYKTPLNSYCAGKLTHLFDCNITQWEIWIRCHRTEVEMRRHVRLQIKNWKRLKHCESNLSLQSDDSTSQMAHGWSSSQLDMPPKQVFYLKGRPVQTWCVTKSLSFKWATGSNLMRDQKSLIEGVTGSNLMCDQKVSFQGTTCSKPDVFQLSSISTDLFCYVFYESQSIPVRTILMHFSSFKSCPAWFID